jgi:hypothetical protein
MAKISGLTYQTLASQIYKNPKKAHRDLTERLLPYPHGKGNASLPPLPQVPEDAARRLKRTLLPQ